MRARFQDKPTVIRLADGSVVGYRVPATLVDQQLMHVEPVEKWAAEFSQSSPRTSDEKRGIACVRRYARWVKYNKDGKLELSADYRRDGVVAERFMEASNLLWRRADQWFPRHYHGKAYRDLSCCSLNPGEEKLCGPWMGCAVNVAVDRKPVETKPHRDIQGFLHGMSCLCPFGKFTGGGLVLWELEMVVELKRGDLFFFMDHLINHSNEEAQGMRHSVVAFTENKV